MSLQMKKSDIVREYKSAKNPKEQIRILADLNCTSQTEIKKVLTEAGVELPQSKAKSAKKPINAKCESTSEPKRTKIASKKAEKPINAQCEEDYGEVEEIEEIE